MDKIFIISSFNKEIKIESIAAPDEYHALLRWCQRKQYKFSSLLFNKEEIINAIRAEHGIEVNIKLLRDLI